MTSKLYKAKKKTDKDGKTVVVKRKELVAPSKVTSKKPKMSDVKKAMGVKKSKGFNTKHEAGMAKLKTNKRKGVTATVVKVAPKKAKVKEAMYQGKKYKSAHEARMARLRKK